jgi:hypothetical protein
VKYFGAEATPGLMRTGARVPVMAIRAVFVLVGTLMSLDVYGANGWLVVGAVFALAAAIAPQFLLAWGVIIFLAIGQLTHHAALSWRFLVLLAGLHLIHVISLWTLELPWRARVQITVFTHGLVRFLAIQVPVQLVAVLLLSLLAPRASGHRPVTIAACAVVGAAALAVLAVRFAGSQGGGPAASNPRARDSRPSRS